jgi:hypothetical protein
MPYRMYAISLMAVNKSHKPPPGETKSLVEWNHTGAACIAENMEDAGRQGKEHVYEAYPVSKGYSLHSVVVSPIQQSFFDTLEQLCAAEEFFSGAAPNEQPQTFNFDPDVVNDYYFETDGQTH